VREEGERLVLCAGIPPRWLDQDTTIRFGPAPTAFGAVCLSITPARGNPPRVEWRGDWHRGAPQLEIRMPGFEPVQAAAAAAAITLVRKKT